MSGEQSPVPADLSCGEDESLAQAVVIASFSIVECLLKMSNQKLKKQEETHAQPVKINQRKCQNS